MGRNKRKTLYGRLANTTLICFGAAFFTEATPLPMSRALCLSFFFLPHIQRVHVILSLRFIGPNKIAFICLDESQGWFLSSPTQYEVYQYQRYVHTCVGIISNRQCTPLLMWAYEIDQVQQTQPAPPHRESRSLTLSCPPARKWASSMAKTAADNNVCRTAIPP